MNLTTPPLSRPPAVELMRHLGLEPDPWQAAVLEAGHPRLLLNCCRQAGKSTAVALLGLAQAVFEPGTKVLLLSRSHRQSRELFRVVVDFYRRLGKPMQQRLTGEELHRSNFSSIVSLPCREDTVRGYSGVSLLGIDEAARVPDELYRAVRPMLAVSANGRLVCMSTPHGKRGFFYHAWTTGGADWFRIEVPAGRVARISPDFLAQERRALGEITYRQEYECSFEALEGLVYPDFGRCVTGRLSDELRIEGRGVPGQRRVGGIDFGFRNPFAAVWGVVDRDDVLWLLGEHYQRQQPLSHHAAKLPREVVWYADPSGASDISELRCVGFKVQPGPNALRTGIAAVSARLADGTLRVLAGRCPNLLAEAELYRYGDDSLERQAEAPVDEYNYAPAALRYLVAGLDARRMARPRRPAATPEPPKPKRDPWLRYDHEALWTRIY